MGVQDQRAIAGGTRDFDYEVTGRILPDVERQGVEMPAEHSIYLPFVADGGVCCCKFGDKFQHRSFHLSTNSAELIVTKTSWQGYRKSLAMLSDWLARVEQPIVGDCWRWLQ